MVAQRVATSTLATLHIVTDRGRVLPVEVDTVGEVSGRSRGTPVAELVALDKGEEVRTIVAPQTGWLSCRQHGAGRMAEPEAIATRIAAVLADRPRKTPS